MRINWKAVIGTALSLALLAWVLHDISLREVLHELRQADPLLFALAIFVSVLGMPIRAARWGTLLHPLAPRLPFAARNAATVVGFAANNLLPARIGEFARAFTLGRLTGLPVSAALGSLVLERVFDGIVIVGLLAAAMAAPGFPDVRGLGGVDLGHAAVLMGGAMAAMVGVLFALVLAPGYTVALVERVVTRLLPPRARRLVLDVLHAFLSGLGVLKSPRLLLLSLLWALGQWGFLALSYLLAFRAFGIDDVGLTGALFLQSFMSLAVSIPSSPGFFGPFEAAARLGLGLWGVPVEKAVSFAVGFHIGGFIPVTLWGLYYVSRLNLSWRELEQSEAVVEQRVEREAGVPAGEPAPGEG